MAIPDFDDEGFLPSGVHPTTLEEIRSRFGQFQHSDVRCQLANKLDAFLKEARSSDLFAEIIINGSFISAKDEPNDIDLILVLNLGHDFAAELRPFEYNVISRRQVRRRFGFDVLVAQLGQPEHFEYVQFFSQVRGNPGRQKGMLRITL